MFVMVVNLQLDGFISQLAGTPRRPHETSLRVRKSPATKCNNLDKRNEPTKNFGFRQHSYFRNLLVEVFQLDVPFGPYLTPDV